ncbi:hypothetical protein IJ425_01950 [bacterium]|nr:hypothetical protein [bacterium]
MRVCCVNGINSVFKTNVAKKANNNVAISPFKSDIVSFSSKYVNRPLNVDWDTAKTVTDSLSTSTSGHRAEYGTKVFNEDVVKMLTLGVADYAKEEAKNNYPERTPIVLIGGDARKATKESLPIINETLLGQGVEVIYIPEPIPTPALAYAAKKYDVDAAVLMTASHNPWEDGGYNMVTKEGAIAPASVTKKVANHALNHVKKGYYKELKNPFAQSSAFSHVIYPYELYKNLIDSHEIIDWEGIKDSNLTIYYDGLQGAGSNIMPRLLEEKGIPFYEVKSKGQIGPNPTKENLKMLSRVVKNSDGEFRIGLSNDGDADRFGVIDENGDFISTNDVLLLATYHLVHNRGIDGVLLRSHATSSQLDELAQRYDRPVIDTPVGFKYIGEKILNLRKEGKDILIAGEESGGLTINSHVPEKDGILATLLIADLVAQEEKPLSQILKDVKADLSNYYSAKSINIRLEDNAKKDAILAKAKDIYNAAMVGENEFGSFEIDAKKTREHQKHMQEYKQSGDGVKLFFVDGSSVLIRKSGTEPLIRYYIEAIDEDSDVADNKVEKIEQTLNEVFV